MRSGVRLVKAHAYGNDFLCVSASEVGPDAAALARAVCDRHRGIGADGLVVFTIRDRGASMALFNADGGRAELSGNGLRCLAALVASEQRLQPGEIVVVETDAGPKNVELLGSEGTRYTFRTAMGQPQDLRRVELDAAGERVAASTLTMGNPQCIVLGPLPDPVRFGRLGPILSTHAVFPAGTNVGFAEVEAADRIRILIWERGVGPTSSSGTGTSACAVVATAHGGAARSMEVVAPGGTQRVDWREDGVYLTGWAEQVMDGRWTGPRPLAS